jgi:hypothetical protein
VAARHEGEFGRIDPIRGANPTPTRHPTAIETQNRAGTVSGHLPPGPCAPASPD